LVVLPPVEGNLNIGGSIKDAKSVKTISPLA